VWVQGASSDIASKSGFFAIFVKTVIMKPFLGYIPDSRKKDEFFDAFLDKLERSGQSWSLDFMLLSIFARR
jgi:hypothetical protein